MTIDDTHVYLQALRDIETHIRSSKEPLQYIVETLKRVLPEYADMVTVERHSNLTVTL